MANIMQYVQRTSPRDNGQMARATPAIVSNTNPLATFSDAMYAQVDIQQRREDEQGRAWAIDAVSQARLEWTSRLVESQQGAELGAPEFTKKFVGEFDEYSTKALGSAPTPSAKKYLHQQLNEIRTSLGEKAITFEAGARVDYRDTKFNTAIGNVQKLMNADVSQYEPGLNELLSVIDTSEMPPAARANMREKAIAKVSEAAVWSQINRSPDQFLASIGADGSKPMLNGMTGNKAFDALSFDERTRALTQALSAKKSAASEMEQAAEKERKQRGDDYMKEALARLSPTGDTPRLSRAYVEEARPWVSPAEYKTLLTALNDGGLGGEGGARKSDPGVFRDLQAKVYEDPEGAKKDALMYHANGMLSNSDLSSVMTRADSTDRKTGPKSSYERVHKYIIDSLDPGQMVKDPVGRGRMAEAVNEFDKWVQAGPNGKRTDEEIERRGEEIIKQWRFVNLSETAAGLPQPRFGTVPRNSVNNRDAHLAAVGAAWNATKKAYAEKRITKQEYMEEASRINQWMKLTPPPPAPKAKQ